MPPFDANEDNFLCAPRRKTKTFHSLHLAQMDDDNAGDILTPPTTQTFTHGDSSNSALDLVRVLFAQMHPSGSFVHTDTAVAFMQHQLGVLDLHTLSLTDRYFVVSLLRCLTEHTADTVTVDDLVYSVVVSVHAAGNAIGSAQWSCVNVLRALVTGNAPCTNHSDVPSLCLDRRFANAVLDLFNTLDFTQRGCVLVSVTQQSAALLCQNTRRFGSPRKPLMELFASTLASSLAMHPQATITREEFCTAICESVYATIDSVAGTSQQTHGSCDPCSWLEELQSVAAKVWFRSQHTQRST